MSIEATTEFEMAPSNPLMLPLAAAAACAALADWLFFDWQVGISLALFYGVIGVVAVAVNGIRAQRRVQIIMTSIFVAGLLALIEDVGMLSVIWSSLATASFVIVMTACESSPWPWRLFEAATVPLRGPFRLIGDILGVLRHMKKLTPGWLGSLVAWIVPLSIFAVFVTLFSSANPLIEQQLKRIDLRVLLDIFAPWRTAFWIVVMCAIWPLMRRRAKPAKIRPHPADSDNSEPSDIDHLFGTAAMLRSLILFNALFALQSALDLTYLWGGASLPNGMSNAEYAHRGAYPLIVTALLAAGFALMAMRPGGPAENSRWIRPLVLAWIGQNILLVISSILRLDLYIAAFSLTYLRLAAFIWMGLVAIGLALMLVQITGRKSTMWLFNANAISLALTLYGCCFLNAPWLVARYNVEHSREVTGSGASLDLEYLALLGSPQVLPPIEAHLSKFPQFQLESLHWYLSRINEYRGFPRPENWRAWGFRTWRL
ncbi:MAG TPA: DUF4173 domain-containing protein, partial [Bradyrhizobium sp.]